jgi:hypothetical protein
MGIYTYKVLRAVDPAEVSIDDGHPLREGMLHLVGEFKAKEPGLAALAAAEQVGQPGTYVAVPERNFNDTPIVPTTGFMIADPDAGEPPPPPPEGEVAAGLDPAHKCETDECGHLPAEHGAGGLGICRVEGCPCGKYEPAP